MGTRPILCVKVPVTIYTMLNFNGPNFGSNIGVVTCEQAFKIGPIEASELIFCLYIYHFHYTGVVFIKYVINSLKALLKCFQIHRIVKSRSHRIFCWVSMAINFNKHNTVSSISKKKTPKVLASFHVRGNGSTDVDLHLDLVYQKIDLNLDLDSSAHSLCDKVSQFWMRISSKHQHWALGTCSIHRRTIRRSMKTAGKAIHHTNLRFKQNFAKKVTVLCSPFGSQFLICFSFQYLFFIILVNKEMAIYYKYI